jgi:hypothetical protein
MKFLILIYSNPASRNVWDDLSDAERSAGLQQYAALTNDLNASGEMVVPEALASPSRARRVLRDSHTITSEGPYAELKEHLAGYYLVECPTIERAIEHASRIPEAAYGLVDVWPVIGLDELASER